MCFVSFLEFLFISFQQRISIATDFTSSHTGRTRPRRRPRIAGPARARARPRGPWTKKTSKRTVYPRHCRHFQLERTHTPHQTAVGYHISGHANTCTVGAVAEHLSILRRSVWPQVRDSPCHSASSGQEGVSVVPQGGVIATGAGGDGPRR